MQEDLTNRLLRPNRAQASRGSCLKRQQIEVGTAVLAKPNRRICISLLLPLSFLISAGKGVERERGLGSRRCMILIRNYRFMSGAVKRYYGAIRMLDNSRRS